jgi:hypothetical protein
VYTTKAIEEDNQVDFHLAELRLQEKYETGPNETVIEKVDARLSKITTAETAAKSSEEFVEYDISSKSYSEWTLGGTWPDLEDHESCSESCESIVSGEPLIEHSWNYKLPIRSIILDILVQRICRPATKYSDSDELAEGSEENNSNTTQRNASASSSSSNKERGRKAPFKFENKRRSVDDGDENFPEDGEDRPFKRITRNKSTPIVDKRFACPWYQRNPELHQKASCTGPGWTWSRLK